MLIAPTIGAICEVNWVLVESLFKSRCLLQILFSHPLALEVQPLPTTPCIVVGCVRAVVVVVVVMVVIIIPYHS